MPQMTRHVEVEPPSTKEAGLPAAEIRHGDDNHAVGVQQAGELLQQLQRIGKVFKAVPKGNGIETTANEVGSGGVNGDTVSTGGIRGTLQTGNAPATTAGGDEK